MHFHLIALRYPQPWISPRHLCRGNITRRRMGSFTFIEQSLTHADPHAKTIQSEVIATVGGTSSRLRTIMAIGFLKNHTLSAWEPVCFNALRW